MSEHSHTTKLIKHLQEENAALKAGTVERFIALVRSHKVMKRNKWQPDLRIDYLSTGVKVATLQISTGARYPTELFHVTRSDNDLRVVLLQILSHANEMLDGAVDETHKEKVNG